MQYVLKNAAVYTGGTFIKTDVRTDNGRIVSLSPSPVVGREDLVFDFTDCMIFPGFTDVHVHLREPGFSYKETISTGTRAAARGGYTHICAMPNLSPVPDSAPHLQEQLQKIARDAVIDVLPYGALTVGEKGETLSDMDAMAAGVIGFSDDGKGVQSSELMLAAMQKAKTLGKILAAHCEDNTLLHGGYIHDGVYAAAHGHKGICSQSEYGPIARDIALAAQTGVSYHVCHVSAKESVELIRRAKAQGVNITCETGPHYLVFCDEDLQEDGRFKMNPPLRAKDDREALIAGICDGTIDLLATDHAPHSEEEKSKGLAGSLMGVVGLETAFSAVYTALVKTGIITLERLMALLCDNARDRFGIGTPLVQGAPADLCVFDLNAAYTVDPQQFLSMGKSTPFTGKTLYGKCLLTLHNGAAVWQDKNTNPINLR